MLSFDRTPPLDAIRSNLAAAAGIRMRLLSDRTNAYRICNAEGDGIPGLIVDRYDDVLVIQIGTLGIERLRTDITAILLEALSPSAVYERSDSASRSAEGLQPRVGWCAGAEQPTSVAIREDGLAYVVPLVGAQKTGFYLDQREMRLLIRSLAAGRRVLDCFCYTGAFSVAALAGGAERSTLVDSSAAALELAAANLSRNGIAEGRATAHRGDVFRYLHDATIEEDLVILDPPAFAKSRTDVEGALRGYREINRLAFEKLRPGALLLSCSCSYHVDPALFQTTVFRAAREVGRPVRILARHRMAADHPVSLFHPETEYLKSLLMVIG
jgi:23S rRNA (cytosine1962-C5)-methyltransferase